MKKRWIHLSNRLLSGMLVLLGFSRCTSGTESPVEYGIPYSKYEIKGKVTDIQSQNGIPDIQVVVINQKEFGYESDTLETDYNGEFIYRKTNTLDNPVKDFRIICKDIDGEANGGVYRKSSTDVRTVKTENGKGWYGGKGEAEVTIKLEKE